MSASKMSSSVTQECGAGEPVEPGEAACEPDKSVGQNRTVDPDKAVRRSAESGVLDESDGANNVAAIGDVAGRAESILPVQSPPLTQRPVQAAPDVRQRLQELAVQLRRSGNRRVLLEFMNLRRALR